MTRKRGGSEAATRASKRRKGDDEATVPAVTQSHGRRGRAQQEDMSVFSLERCANWFASYVDEDAERIGPEGIEAFCRDIGVAPEHVVVLIIAWRLNAATMGYLTKAEWMSGMQKLGCDTADKMRALLPSLPNITPAEFKELYRFSFDFARDPSQKSLEMETAKAMLSLLLAGRWQSLDQFVQFLGTVSYKVVNKDQWMSILEFSSTIQGDLSNYDEMAAWPVLLDEFVEYLREGSSMQ